MKAVDPKTLDLSANAQVMEIHWRTEEHVVVVETRGLDVVDHSDEHYVLRMRVRCRAARGPVVLAGDPQHAGQQFRAPNQFAEDGAEPVLYLRPEGAEELGNDVWTACDWIAAVLRLERGPVTVLRIESPTNPGKATWSTRPYGRFGATRTVTISADEPLRLEQHYVVALGARDAAWCQQQANRWRQPAAAPRADGEHRRDRGPGNGR